MALQPYASPRERVWYWAFRALCALILLFLVLPILVIIPISFSAGTMLTYPLPGFSLRWYEEFLGSIMWTSAVKNSLIVASATTLLATTAGTVAALGLTRADFPLKRLLTALLISPMVVPVVITAVGVYFFFAQIGLTNTYAGLVLAHTALAVPFVLITVTAILQGFDADLVRAGASLGARPLTVFLRITLPLILPGVISGALFAFATSFDDVVVALFIAGPEQRTLRRQMFAGIRENISPAIAAVATVTIAVSVLLLVAVELLRRRSERLRGATPR